MGQLHFDPARYLSAIRADLPSYDELQQRLSAASAGVDADRILDLGAGTGETSRAVRRLHPDAAIVAVDESRDMLARVDVSGVEARVARLQDDLPTGPFDLVDVSVAPLTDGYDKPDRVRDQLAWLREAGFETELLWERDDLALIRAERP